ncbi:MAG: hypothetical protein WC246_03125 [Candidatus Paceibacterota bacterium]
MRLPGYFAKAREWVQKYRREIALFIVVALMMSCVFGLGYLWGRDASSPPIVIETHAP